MTVFFASMKLTLQRVKFAVIVLCSDELAFRLMSLPLLRKSRADCSTVGLDCATITWQQIFNGSLYITVAGLLPLFTVQRRHLGK